MAIVQDPDRFALAIVQQYCYEHGYVKALEALEQEGGLRVKDEVQQGSQLLKLVYDHVERQLAATGEDDASTARRQLEEELLSSGSPTSTGRCPSRLLRAVEGLHTAAVICIQCWPHRRQAITGAGDGTVTVLDYSGQLVRRIAAAGSGVLCLALHPGSGSGSSNEEGHGSLVVAAGCMDGSVVVLDAGSGAVLARAQPHRKYVVSAAWSPDGAYLVTAAWDQSFAVHAVRRGEPAAAAAGQAEAGQGASSSSAGSGWELVTVHTEQTAGKVNCVLFLPAAVDGDGSARSSSFLLAVQGSNYLRRISIDTDAGAGSVQEGSRINMNATGDDHVSFSAASLALSCCGRLLLVSADNGRLNVYETQGWSLVRTLIGLPCEQFHQFNATFDASGIYVMAAAAHGGLAIFHVGSTRRMALLAAHSKNVRGLAYDAPNNLLLTCSLDRSIKFWEAERA